MTTTDLYPYLIIIGSSILVAAGWLLHQYRRQLNLTRDLIQLNEQLGYDLPNFLAQCWPLLQRSGFTGMLWELNWFGTRVGAQYGQGNGEEILKKFDVQEISLRIHLFRNKGQFEQQYFSDAQAENFYLLVRMNLWIKLGSVQGAFEQTAKMTVFLKHDVKNMVQLLSLSAEQLENDAPDEQGKLLENLRETVPALRVRAEHMLRALDDKPARRRARTPVAHAPFELEKLLEQTAALYDLPVTISGNGTLHLEQETLMGIIDNLLGNYSRLARSNPARRPDLAIGINQGPDFVTITIEDTNGSPFPWPERLFEPFWSEHGRGRGIGLYQARQQAQALGGELSAQANQNNPLIFNLKLPVNLI